MQLKKRRLFIDPASISSGWALFEGTKLVKSGTVLVNKKLKVSQRLGVIYKEYKKLGKVDEVHVEDIPRARTCHIYVHYSVGVILAALATKATQLQVDIPVKAWQKFVDWDRDNKNNPQGSTEETFKTVKGGAKSRDELAAIGMGLWYLNKEKLNENGFRVYIK